MTPAEVYILSTERYNCFQGIERATLQHTSKFRLIHLLHVQYLYTLSQMTPLHLACQRGHLKVVQVLLKHKAETYETIDDQNGYNSLDLAIENGHE